jgi:hypothetical protein
MDAINTLMDRLRAFFTAQRALVADAAHELRSPSPRAGCSSACWSEPPTRKRAVPPAERWPRELIGPCGSPSS